MSRLYFASLALSCGLTLAGVSASAQTPSFKVLHTLKGATDGAEPIGRLLKLGDHFYGTTLYGGGATKCNGGYSCGTLYSVNPTSHTYHLLHAFGLTAGDALRPEAGLARVGHTLYGTTSATDSPSTPSCVNGCGNLFSFDTSTGAYQIVYSFLGGSDGWGPGAEMTNVDGLLYGTTQYGGGGSCVAQYGCGTIFSFDPKTGIEKTLYAFQGTPDGYFPTGQLIEFEGKLYGVTMVDGSTNNGIVFSFDTTTGAYSILHSFKGGKDGALPGMNARLHRLGRQLYGTTREGGLTSNDISACSKKNKGCGTIFTVNMDTGAETVVHSFAGQEDGTYPVGGLVDVAGTLYGTSTPATCGDPQACGLIYALDPGTGALTVVYQAARNDGRGFYMTLRESDGTLYGTADSGGKGSACNLISGGACGTVFAFTP